MHPADKRGPDPERFLEDLLAKNPKVRFEPGIRASYTNIGYLALGQVVAAVTGMSYEAYVSDQVLEPLGMTNTGFQFTAAMADSAATPYRRRLSPMRFLLPRWTVGSAEDGFVFLNRPSRVHTTPARCQTRGTRLQPSGEAKHQSLLACRFRQSARKCWAVLAKLEAYSE